MIIEVVEGVKAPKRKEILPEIFSRMFAICKYDKSYSRSEQLEGIDQEILEMKRKIDKKESLIRQSEQMKETFTSKLTMLDESNDDLRSQLLESLGSEL
jgi:septal ring factor EnvC (AmiA/AmiB activator)